MDRFEEIKDKFFKSHLEFKSEDKDWLISEIERYQKVLSEIKNVIEKHGWINGGMYGHILREVMKEGK